MSRALLPVLALALALAGCGTATVSAEDVATAAEDAFEEESGVRFPITCPEDLEAEVGAETHCVLTNTTRGEDFDVLVRVTSVEDGVAEFDVQVDNEPLG